MTYVQIGKTKKKKNQNPFGAVADAINFQTFIQ